MNLQDLHENRIHYLNNEYAYLIFKDKEYCPAIRILLESGRTVYEQSLRGLKFGTFGDVVRYIRKEYFQEYPESELEMKLGTKFLDLIIKQRGKKATLWQKLKMRFLQMIPRG